MNDSSFAPNPDVRRGSRRETNAESEPGSRRARMKTRERFVRKRKRSYVREDSPNAGTFTGSASARRERMLDAISGEHGS